MLYNPNAYNVHINVQLAYCQILIVWLVKEILEPQHHNACKIYKLYLFIGVLITIIILMEFLIVLFAHIYVVIVNPVQKIV